MIGAQRSDSPSDHDPASRCEPLDDLPAAGSASAPLIAARSSCASARVCDLLLGKKPSDPANSCPFGPRVSLLGYESAEGERSAEAEPAHLAGGKLGLEEDPFLDRLLESAGC